jgi:hypothetical protein
MARSFSSFFSQKKTALPDFSTSSLLTLLKKTAKENGFFFFENITLHHRQTSFHFPLLLLLPNGAICLLEHRQWHIKELLNAKPQIIPNQKSTHNTLAFDAKHKFIKQRLQETLNIEEVPIFHFAVLENISLEEYATLQDTCKTLLPQEHLIFSSYTDKEIYNCFKPFSSPLAYNATQLLHTLFPHQFILNKSERILPSQQQRTIIESPMTGKGIQYVGSLYGSGKSTTLILKAIFEHLNNKKTNITILAPSVPASALLMQKLMEIAEHTLIDIDFHKVVVTSPDALNRIRNGIVLIDDFSILDTTDLFNKLEKKDVIIFEQSHSDKTYKYQLTQAFRPSCNTENLYGDIYLNTFIKITELIKQNIQPEQIAVVTPDEQTSQNIMEDLPNFFENTVQLLGKTYMPDADMDKYPIVATFDALSCITKDYIIALAPPTQPSMSEFIASKATKTTYFIFNEEKQNAN